MMDTVALLHLKTNASTEPHVRCVVCATIRAEKNAHHVDVNAQRVNALHLNKTGAGALTEHHMCATVATNDTNASLNATPMALSKLALPASLLEGLGLEQIEPQNVQARPELIEHARKTKSA